MKIKAALVLTVFVLSLILSGCAGAEEGSPVVPLPTGPRPTAPKSAELAPTELTAPEPEDALTMRYDLYFADEKLDAQAICYRNRPYVLPESLSVCLNGETLRYQTEELRHPHWQTKDGEYISLADAAVLGDLEASFDEDTETIRLYRRAEASQSAGAARTAPADEAHTAYLRLEDIKADFGLNGRFTHENLLKLRVLGDYLRDRTDAFYIAWIPLYVDPPHDIVNDISEDLNFYNVDFVYTLDRLIGCGGILGLHGYTHQSGDEVSAGGFEFGEGHEYTMEALLDRFAKAEAICAKLDYTYAFFEFPHYDATPFQREVASAYFDVCYQQLPDVYPLGRIETVTVNGHSCRWIPTPADYVYGREDLSGILDRLTKSKNDGQILSLFFHPALDNDAVEVRAEGDAMYLSYNEQTGLLAAIIRLVDSWGCRFGAF